MNAVKPRISIERVLKPRSVAIIGATEDEAKFGGRFTNNLIRHGYAGEFLPINPGRPTILGRKAYPNIKDAPGPIDLALIAVPASQLQQAIDDCCAAGVGACVVVTAQLGEFDEAGAKLQDSILASAARCGMRIIGPNCMGMVVATHAMGLTSSPTLRYAHELKPGVVGFVSQSGALMGALFVFGYDHGVGFTSLVSVGNQADLDLTDFFEALVDDNETRVICLYIEGIKDGSRFKAVACRARDRGKRVIAVKAGRTEAGRAMARSHTASLAGSFSAFEAMCAQTGILLMDEPEAMILAAGVLAHAPKLETGGVGMVVSSGGGGAVTADRLLASRLPLAQWTAETRTKLDTYFLRSHQNNPIDLGAHIGVLQPAVFTDTMDIVAADANTAAFTYIMTPQPLMPQTAQGVVDIWKKQEKPVVFVLDTSRFADDVRELLLKAGMPFVTRIDDAIRIFDLLVRERDMVPPDANVPRPTGAGSLPKSVLSGSLTEPEAKALFAHYGITTPRETLVNTVDEAISAAREIGFPVVAKGVSRAVTHKSDFGLVKLGLKDNDDVEQAFTAILAALKKAGAAENSAISIQEMVNGEAELIVGAQYDATFGPQIMVGIGGTMVELLRDVQIACAPVSSEYAGTMLRKLQLWPMLDGARGRPKLDVERAAEIISRLSWLAHDLGPRLVDLEINPLILRAKGQGAVAVDGRGAIAE